MRNYHVIMISELVSYVGKDVAANTSYRISVHAQRNSAGNLIHDIAFKIEILTGINVM
jgi:hypothetical protein